MMNNQVLFAGYHVAVLKAVTIKKGIDDKESEVICMKFREKQTKQPLFFYRSWPVLKSPDALLQMIALGVDVTKDKDDFLLEFYQMEGFDFIVKLKVVEYNSGCDIEYRNVVDFVLPYSGILADRLIS